MHLIGFITNKFVTMYGHMNVKKKKKTLISFRIPNSAGILFLPERLSASL